MNAVCCISKIEDTLHLDIAYGIDYMNWYTDDLVRVQYVICCTLSVFTAHNKSWNPLQKFPDKWILHPSISSVLFIANSSLKIRNH